MTANATREAALAKWLAAAAMTAAREHSEAVPSRVMFAWADGVTRLTLLPRWVLRVLVADPTRWSAALDVARARAREQEAELAARATRWRREDTQRLGEFAALALWDGTDREPAQRNARCVCCDWHYDRYGYCANPACPANPRLSRERRVELLRARRQALMEAEVERQLREGVPGRLVEYDPDEWPDDLLMMDP